VGDGLGEGVGAATCVGGGLSDGEGAVSGDDSAVQAAVAVATTKAAATARAFRRKRTGARIAQTITPRAEVPVEMRVSFDWLLITQ
jgi:hypothetical protein